jgi:hypothetical protein
MKKVTIILTALIAITITTNAQIPNSGFENWTTFGSYMNPDGWGTGNSSSTSSFYPVTRANETYPTSVGNYSIRIENRPALLPGFEAMGVIISGTKLVGPSPTFPISGHPNSFTGYYKFAPVNNDTMIIGIALFKNGSQVSGGDFSTTTSVSNWTSFNIPLSTYTTADSGYITISAFQPGPHPYNIPRGNSVLNIDNLNFDNLLTSVSELTSENTGFSLYPNPASEFVTLNIDNLKNALLTLNIYNGIGSLVKSEIFKQNNLQIYIGDLSNGFYTVEIKSKELTSKQKLIIQR